MLSKCYNEVAFVSLINKEKNTDENSKNFKVIRNSKLDFLIMYFSVLMDGLTYCNYRAAVHF